MRKNIFTSILVIGLMMFGWLTHALDAPPLAPASPPATSGEIGETDMGIHVLAGGWRVFPGLAVSTNYVIDGRWTLGGTFSYMRSRVAESEGGNLDNAQYYSQYLDQRSLSLEGTATFFIRENGVRRWGPLFRGGVGYAYRRTNAAWTRYDRNPAWITFGSDNRALESGEGKTRDLSTFYTRVGAAFQFALGKQSILEGGGHILELGVNGVIPFSRKSASYARTTGALEEINAPFIEPMLDISYRLIF